jgi:hypothetical protein
MIAVSPYPATSTDEIAPLIASTSQDPVPRPQTLQKTDRVNVIQLTTKGDISQAAADVPVLRLPLPSHHDSRPPPVPEL